LYLVEKGVDAGNYALVCQEWSDVAGSKELDAVVEMKL